MKPVLERTFIDDIKRLIEDPVWIPMLPSTPWCWRPIGIRQADRRAGAAWQEPAEYGTQLLKVLSEELSAAFGKGFSARNLRNYRQFYLSFPHDEIWHTRVPILHGRIFEPYCGLRTMRPASGIWMKLHKKCGASVHLIAIYRRNTIIVCSNHRKRKRSYRKWNPWRRRMKRTSWSSSRIRWLQSGLASNMDFTESRLESAILTHLQKFIMEMGKGYAFVARQQHISTDAGDYFIDLYSTITF